MFDKKDILDKKLKIETEFSKEINKIIKNYDSYSFKQKQAVNQSLNTLLVNISNLINSTAYQEPFTFYESQCESEKDIRDFEIYRRWNARSECSRLNIYPSLLVIGGSKIGYNEALYAALSQNNLEQNIIGFDLNGDKLKQVVLDKRPRYLIVSVALSDLATCKIIKEIKLKLGDSIHIIAVIGSELMISSCEESGADKIIDRQEKFGEIVNYIKGVEQSVESGNPVGKAVDLQPKQQVKTREKYLFRVLVDKIKTDD